MKTITVKKNRCHRLGIRFIAISFLILSSILGFCSLPSLSVVAVICSPWLLVLIVLVCYYETWGISFLRNEIQLRYFFIIKNKHTYSQITDVSISYSYTDHAYISMFFSDGRVIRYKMKDENAERALGKLRSHHSIRIAK